MRGKVFKFQNRALLLGLMVAVMGCGKERSKEELSSFNVGNCGPVDQRGSYRPPADLGQGSVRVFPVNFGTQDEGTIRRAAQAWNAHLAPRRRSGAFVVEGARVGSSSSPPSKNYCPHMSGGSGQLEVRSSHQLPDASAAVTFRCYLEGKLEKQIVVVRSIYQNHPQLMSIALHELGHALGLEHSCSEDGVGRPDYVSCGGVHARHPYRLAVLFPTLMEGQRKESLRTNDQERANCLYP